MSETNYEIGSPAWIEFVRTSPLARNPLGRSRPTQRFSPLKLPCSGRPAVAEGGNELTLVLLVDLLLGLGLIKWFKEQPFSLTEAENGVEAVPDLIFEWAMGGLMVVEAKSKKYLTVDVEAKCKRIADVMAAGSIGYALLNDKNHLGKPLWANVRNIALAAKSEIPVEDIRRAMVTLESGPAEIRAFAQQGICIEAVRLLLTRGFASYNLLSHETVDTIVSRKINPEPYYELFGAKPNVERWWNSLTAWSPNLDVPKDAQ